MSEIEAASVNSELVKDIIDNAGMVVTVDAEDGEIYVRDGLDFPCYINVDEARNLIQIRTYLKCKEGAPVDQLEGLVFSMNSSKILVTFTATVYEDGRAYLNGNYFMYTKFGLNTKNFIYTIRKFSEIFVESVRESDSDDVFFD